MFKRLLSHSIYIIPILFMILLCYSVLSGSIYLGAADDAFFYFRIADNFVGDGLLSFDGLTATNGFHPLWMGALVLLRFFVSGPEGFLSSVFVLSAVLMTMCGVQFIRFASSRYSFPVILLVLFFLLRYMRDFALMCMETSILLPVSFALLSVVSRLHYKSSRRDFWLTGILMALMGAARLDSVVLGLLILLYVFKSFGKRALLPCMIPGVLFALSYFSLNFAFTGGFISVSSMMKASGFGFNHLFFNQLFLFSDPLGFRSPWGLYLLLLAASIPTLIIRRLPDTAKISSLFLILSTAAQLFFSQWRLWYWYAYPAVIFLAFGLPSLLQLIYGKLNFTEKLRKATCALMLCAVFVLSIYWGLSYGQVEQNDFRNRNMLIARELNGLLSDSAVIAMGDRAGSLAYFFQGNVIQSEGLAGNGALVEAIQSGNLEEHLHTLGADYIFSWTGPHLVNEYDNWDIVIPDIAQSAVFNNVIKVYRQSEIYRWTGESESAFLWSFNED